MKVWLVLLAASLAFMVWGAITHRMTEKNMKSKIKLEDLSTPGSVLFAIGFFSFVFSAVFIMICLGC